MSKRRKKDRFTPALKYSAAPYRHPVARGDEPERAPINPYSILFDILHSREQKNSLPWLNPEKARDLFSAWRKGEIAEVQLTWDQLEEYDETLATVLGARLGALAEMSWRVVIDSEAVGEDPALSEQAKAQQATLNRHLNAVENIDEALLHLGMADFRGVAALEITGNAPVGYRWEVIEPWCLARPTRRGAWYYNANADPVPTALEELDPEHVIIREARPIDLPAMFLICAKHHSIGGWDSFIDVFGNPSVFFEMPPNTDEARAKEYEAIVRRIIGEGRGTVPAGGKFQTIETVQTKADVFSERAKWCNEQLITLAMGGLLTVTTAPDSGTLAGNAHADSLARLASLSARSISAAVQRQFCLPVLRREHAGVAPLVRFVFAPKEQEDKSAQAQLISTLAAAGYHPSAETVSELIGFEVEFTPPSSPAEAPGGMFPLANATQAAGYMPTQEGEGVIENTCNRFAQQPVETLEENGAGTLSQNAPSPSADPRQNSAKGQSDTTGDGAPLTEAELTALQTLLGGGLNTAQIERDAQNAQSVLEGAMREGLGKHPQEPSSPLANPLHGVARGQNEAGSQEAEPLVTANREYKRDAQGRFDGNGAIRAAQKGGRASGGNPKAAHKKTTPQQDVDAVERAIKTTASHGGKVTKVARVGKQSLTIEAGNPGTKSKDYAHGYGSSHQQAKHGNPPESTTPRKAAKAIVHGVKKKDPKRPDQAVSVYKGVQASLAPGEKKGTAKMLTAHKKK